MVGQHGVLLATYIIKDHFGEIVSKVCNSLLRKGSLQLQGIARDTGLNESQVKNCLMVLIQHNCVQAYSFPLQHGDNVGTFYMVVFENIIHRMRFTKFLDIVSAKLGPQCLFLLESLLQHGRLTFELLLQHSTSMQALNATKDALLLNFNKLVQAHYVERCPKPEPLLLPEDDEDARPKRRGANFSLDTMTLEKRALEAATLSDAERFMEIVDVAADAQETRSMGEFQHVGEKRKYGDSNVEVETQAFNVEKEILWRANFEKFVQCLKLKVCVAHKRTRLGLEAAMVLEAMIESSGCSQDTVRSSLDNIFERLGGKPQGHIKDIQHARTILEELGCSSSSEETTYYSIDLKEIIKDCQLDEVESLILGRYGQDALRIFRLLAKSNKPFETDKISDITLVDKKNVLGLLLMLWKNSFLHMEKMVSGATPKSYFLWKVNRNAVWEDILDDMYHAAFNLNQRIALNYEKNKEIADCETTNEMQKSMRARYYKRKWSLECALLKLDDSLLLFHDFTLAR